jgi:hypothetical protein
MPHESGLPDRHSRTATTFHCDDTDRADPGANAAQCFDLQADDAGLGIVLLFNLAATLVFGFVICRPGFLPPRLTAMVSLLAKTLGLQIWYTVIMADAAGRIIGMMVWLLPAANATQPMIIIQLTYTNSVSSFPHIIAGSVEASFATFSGHATVADCLIKFLAPMLLGNTLEARYSPHFSITPLRSTI